MSYSAQFTLLNLITQLELQCIHKQHENSVFLSYIETLLNQKNLVQLNCVLKITVKVMIRSQTKKLVKINYLN